MSLIHEITVSKNIVSMTQETFKALVLNTMDMMMILEKTH
jgi:hypothetical protein